MGAPKQTSWLTALGLLSVLILSLFVPQVAASGGEAAIETSSISLGLSEQTELATLTYAFDVVEQNGQSADVTAQSVLKSIDGLILESLNETKTVALNGVETFTVTFTSLPFGYSIIETTITGDVGSTSSSYVLSFNRTVQRLVPLDISIAPVGDVTFTSLDTATGPTGNLSISDGDFLGMQIPVVNNGDYAWNGSMQIDVQSGDSVESITIHTVVVPGMSSTLVYANTSIKMAEGQTSITLTLNDTGDGDSSDEARSIMLDIAPPPLPLMQLYPQLVTTEYVAGDVLEWNLSVTNNGTQSFLGLIVCSFGEVSVLNQSLELTLMASTSMTFTTQARPATLDCDATGTRISVQSNAPVVLLFDVISAVFEAAGSTKPGVLDGPWHVGDSARFSMLVRNHGDVQGTVALECTTSQSVYTSQPLSLDVDAAGEVSVIVPLLNAGDEIIEWRLSSQDGSIDQGLNGSFVVPVAAKQVLQPSVDQVTWDAEVGASMNWSITLGEGVDRSVRVRLGYFDSGETYLLDYLVTLAPGVTTGSLDLGFIDAERATLRVDASNWSEAFGPSSASKSIPSKRPVLRLTLDPVASPSRPVAGQSATIQVSISNGGTVAGSAGELLLLGEDGTLYDTKATPVLDAGESTLVSITLLWPEGARVNLEAVWSVAGEQIKDSSSFTSAEEEIEDAAFSVPWVGILGGIALAGAVLAAIRIKQGQGLGPSGKSKGALKSKSKPTPSKIVSSEEKIQIGCPECARQLRVPASYNGSVRCPDCSNSFEVESDHNGEEIEPDEVEEEQEPDEEAKVELSCPECRQSLRVPNSYAGSVRCPACEHVFKAKD